MRSAGSGRGLFSRFVHFVVPYGFTEVHWPGFSRETDPIAERERKKYFKELAHGNVGVG